LTAISKTEDLDAALSRIEGIRIDTAHVSYGLIDELLEDPRKRIAELLEGLWRGIANYAVIETAGARTTVSWTGDFSTVASHSFQEHAMAVDRILTRRVNFLRIFTAATALAASITAATANPLAIPAAFRAGWKLVTELERIQ
jgi:hypothetical protein